jgi:glyoxylase-like metal-dependent hydrolase (beta-lactamase superfamily II)
MVKTAHFRVDNGDMTLVELESGRRILVDINIREAADDPDDETPDVATQLRDRLDRDDHDRLYVDAFLLTHPDADHIRGLKKHFHFGDPADWSKRADKILIREMWSSPIVFRRASKDHVLCEDADAWAAEARRRVQLFRDGNTIADGNRITILGEDVNGKTDDLDAILVKTDHTFATICGVIDGSFEARLLAPLIAKDEEEEEVITKNNSSVIIRLDLKLKRMTQARYLIGGDADVGVWDRLWEHNEKQPERLEYDLLIAPHHCSWHSLSHDSWSDLGEKAKVSEPARKALGQARLGALIVASSKTISDDDSDPPCVRAKREYEDILWSKKGEFRCVADGAGDSPLEIEILSAGPKIKRAAFAATVAAGTGIGSQPFAHGRSDR